MHHRILAVDDLPTFRCTFLLLVFFLSAVPFCCSAAPIYAVQGEEIPLRGTATGSDVIYLFLTGPNLPGQGIALVGGTPVTTGVPGSFTRVDVNTDGTWAYTWRTGAVGRILDTGTYYVFITEEPLSRPDLDDTVFTEQPVIFGAPVETVTIASTMMTAPVPPGTMQGGQLVTGMQTPEETPSAGTPVPATPGQVGLPAVVPLAAAALALLGSRRRP